MSMTDRVEQAMRGGAAEVARAVGRAVPRQDLCDMVREALERIERGNARIGAVVEPWSCIPRLTVGPNPDGRSSHAVAMP